MLGILAEDLKHTQAVLAEAYANRDTQALRAELHRARGGACYLKVPQLEHTLKAFHQTVKAEPQNPEQWEQTYRELQEAIEAFWSAWNSNAF